MSGFPASGLLLTLILVVSLTVTAAGALIAVLTTRLIRSVSGLALCCVGLAGLYTFLHSPFLGLMQILIYVGAVCITIIFALMLAEPDEPEADSSTASRLWGGVGLALCVALGWVVARLGVGGPWTVPVARVNDGSLKALGIGLLTTYSVAFEAMSLVLLVAILGALAIARGGRGHE